jgi:hypothetical protein
MKHLPTQFLMLSLLLLTAGTSWSENFGHGPQPQPVTPIEQALVELRMDLNKATQFCASEWNNTDYLAQNFSRKNSHFWDTPHWLRCLWHHTACNKLKALQLDQIQFKDIKTQFRDFSQKFEAKTTKNINEYQAKMNNNEKVPPIQAFAQEARGEIGALGAGCKNMSNALQEKLKERYQLIKQIYGKKTDMPQEAKPQDPLVGLIPTS